MRTCAGWKRLRHKKKHTVFFMWNQVDAYDSDFELLFAYKDEILNNLKDKKFYEYKNATITGVKVLVHPSDVGRVPCIKEHKLPRG